MIDITISSRLPVAIHDWRVCRDYNGSDHNTIQFTLEADILELPPVRNYGKADWLEFTYELSKYDPTVARAVRSFSVRLISISFVVYILQK